MSEISFDLPIRSPATARSTTAWLTLGLISLLAAMLLLGLLRLLAECRNRQALL